MNKNNGKRNRILYRLLSIPVSVSAIAIVYFFQIPNPMVILIIPIVLFTYLDGYIGGLMSGCTSTAYSAYFFYIATADNAAGEKLMTILLAVSFIIILVGKLKARDDSKIAELKQAHDDLLKEKELAEELNRSKSEFLSRMSHEIRTPMNAILGATEIQLQKDYLPPGLEETFSTIYNSGNLLLNIINDILDLSKIEAGKLELTPAGYDIPSLINDTMQLNIMRYDSKPVEFILKVDENTPLNMLGDKLRIEQILNNLLSNAFKYTDEGQVELSVFAEFEPETPLPEPEEHTGCVLVLCVSDTGQGMTDEQIDELFEEYTRFNQEANRMIIGAGLGMNITKRFVEMMGGQILVESEAGKGSVFTVRLPQERVGPDVCGAGFAEKLRRNRFHSISSAKKARIKHAYMPYGRVMVVDDVESNRYVAREMLLTYGLEIETAASGFEAVEKIKGGGVYDIIFMDHMMPKMSGIEAVKIIREMGYTHPIVALTANVVEGQQELFLENGFDSFLSKPIDMRELNTLLNRLVRDKKRPEAIEAALSKTSPQKTNLTPDQKERIQARLAGVIVQDVENAIHMLEDLLLKINCGGGDIKLYTTTVHGMKGALANICELELSSDAFRLEQAGNNGEMAMIAAETPVFIGALKALTDRFRAMETKATAEVCHDDTVFLREKLLEIKTACESYNIKTAKTALNDLKEKDWSCGISKVLDEISVNLLRGEFKKVLSIAEETADMLV